MTAQIWRYPWVGLGPVWAQEGYTKAGQYVQVKIGDSKPAFLAIASPPQVRPWCKSSRLAVSSQGQRLCAERSLSLRPGAQSSCLLSVAPARVVWLAGVRQAAREGRLEFLVKAVEGSTAELLTRVQAGQLVQVSQVMGKGFNVDALGTPEDCSSVLLFATGSGIRWASARAHSCALHKLGEVHSPNGSCLAVHSPRGSHCQPEHIPSFPHWPVVCVASAAPSEL